MPDPKEPGWATATVEEDERERLIEEYPDDTARQNGPQVIGQRCHWCGAVVEDADHSRSHD